MGRDVVPSRQAEIIDAEFEVVSLPPEPSESWNGVGVPPEYGRWGLLPKLVFWAIKIGGLALVYFAVRGLIKAYWPN